MKHFFRVFLIVSTIALVCTAWTSIPPARALDLIASAPAYTTARYVDSRKSTRRGNTRYELALSYTVAGKEYEIETDWVNEEESDAMQRGPVLIAYAPSDPAKAVFKEELDERNPADSLGGAIFVTLFTSLTMGLLAALLSLFFRRNPGA